MRRSTAEMNEVKAQIKEFLRDNPDATNAEIGKRFKLNPGFASQIVRGLGLGKGKPRLKKNNTAVRSSSSQDKLQPSGLAATLPNLVSMLRDSARLSNEAADFAERVQKEMQLKAEQLFLSQAGS